MSKKRLLASLLSSSLLLTLASPVLANPQDTMPSFELEETVTTATKTKEKLLSIPASVEVITAKDIKEHNYQTVAEALRSLPGIYFSPINQAGMGNNLQIRGFSSKDILVLLDGMPMNDTYNNDVSWNTLPMNNIAKIEVVKGSSSSLYGGRAVGAVVQIFTKDKTLAPGEVSTSISTKYGSNHTWNNSIHLATQINDRLSLGVGMEKRSSDGFPTYFVKGKTPKTATKAFDYTGKLATNSEGDYLIGTRGDKGYDTRNLSANINYKFNEDQQIRYKYWHTNNRYFYRHPQTFISENGHPLFTGAIKVDKKLITFTPSNFLGYEGFRISDTHVLNYLDNRNNWKVNLGLYKERESGYTSADSSIKNINDNTPGEISNHPGKTINFDITKTWKNLGNRHNLLVGASYKEETMNQIRQYLTHWQDRKSIDTSLNNQGITAHYTGKSKNTALYLQDEYKLNEPLTLQMGLRYDKFTKADGHIINYDPKNNYTVKNDKTYPSTSYTQLSPKLALEYTAKDNTHYYLSYGHSFNPPPLYQIYRDGGGGMGNVIANPELKPEKSDSFEIGMKKDWGRTSLQAALFKVKTTDKIYYKYFYKNGNTKPISDKDKPIQKQYVNGNKEKRHGLELSLQHRFNKTFKGYMNYTYQEGTLYDQGQEVTDYAIPRHLFHTGVQYTNKNLNALLDLEYASPRQSSDAPKHLYGSEDSIWLLNTAINYQLDKRTTMQFAVANIFDKKVYADEPIAGRTYTLGLNYNF